MNQNNKVFFTKDITKVAELFDAAGIKNIITKDDFVALKIHFGEEGNNAYLKPEKAKVISDKVKALGGRPFWTDSNTLYKGSRSDTLLHLETAIKHGYSFEKTGAHPIIADGLEGKAYKKIKTNLKHFKEIFVGPLVLEADAILAITHFKGHEFAGFGGAIKNISMGLASRAGKQQMHADLVPVVNEEKCTVCGRCVKWCPEQAIRLSGDQDIGGKAKIDLSKCVGCGECVATCRFDAIKISWAGKPDVLQEKMAEYCKGIVDQFKGKTAYINFITDVSEACDCYDFNSEPIVPDIGILASFDPVAIDQACIDLINQTDGRIKSKDKFKTLWPNVDWTVQLKYAEEIGMGTRKYELIQF